MRRIIWIGGAIAALTAAGCGGHIGAVRSTSSSSSPSSSTAVVAPTSAPSTPTTSISTIPSATTTVAINTSVVPPVITIAYVNAVLAQLNHVYGNAVRLVVQTGTIPPAAVADLHAIYTGQQYEDELRTFSIQLADGIESIKSNPGDRVFTVVSFIQLRPDCVSMKALGNYNALSTSPEPPVNSYLAISRSTTPDQQSLDPTPWQFSYEMSDPPGPSFCG